MKPPDFDYQRPSSLEEALKLLAEHGDDTKILAGGQSLMPLMNMRLAQPSLIVDVDDLAELRFLRYVDSHLHIGPLVTHRMLEQSALVQQRFPILHEAALWIAHPQIRTRGTVGGSVAHADGSAELPAVLAALDGSVTVRSTSGSREVGWEQLFKAQFMTDLSSEEMITEIRLPFLTAGAGVAFTEIARRRGDFALVGCAAKVEATQQGICRHVALAFLGVSGIPVRARAAENLLRGVPLDECSLQNVQSAIWHELDPPSDLHASASYRRDLAASLGQSALSKAVYQATTGAL